ncbi:MAG: hypothetical protein AB7O96_11125, partial [Pseudobdellovibrionaceae bacterium]
MKTPLALLLSLSLLTGCKSLIGTDTGNPIHSGTSEEPPQNNEPCEPEGCPMTPNPIPQEGASIGLVQSICSKLYSCNNEIGLDACMEDLYVQGRVDGIFTLSFTDMTFEDLHKQEQDKQILPSQTQYSTCANKVQNMSCGDPTIKIAYQPDRPAPFLGGASLLAFMESCMNIFATPPPE